MNTKIRDFKGEVIESLQELSNLNESLSIYKGYESTYSEIEEMLNKVNPSLMFYGVYNAGKSSLLNAIFGQMKASVADVPETHRVTYYKWKNFELVDTPGVNGPEKDYKISKAELSKHNVIMFVIDDSDTFDSSFVAKEIVNIIIEKKPLIVVLNKKQGMEECEEQERVNNIRRKLYENIKKAGELVGLSNIEQKYEFIAVNAETGFRGKDQNKRLLLEDSKISDLEIMISKNLENIDEVRMLVNPVNNIMYLAKKMEEVLRGKVEENDEMFFANLMNDLCELKSNSLNNLHTLIRMEIRRYNELMYSSLVGGNGIEDLQNDLSNKVNEYISREMEKFCSESSSDIKTSIKKAKLSFDVSTYEENDESYSFGTNIEVATSDSTFDDIEKIIDEIPIIMPIPNPTPIPTPVIILGLKIIISLFKKEKGRNLEDVMQEVEIQNARQREMFNNRMNAMQEARTQINIYLYKFEEEALKIAEENINKIYGERTESINKLIVNASDNLRVFNEANSKIMNIKLNLEDIKSQLLI